MTPSLFLFDDGVARGWEPFALTRPAGELLFGTMLLRERAERYWGMACQGHLAHERLQGFQEPGAPPVLAPDQLPREGLRILLSARAAPSGPPPLIPPEGGTLVMEGRTVGWILSHGDDLPPLQDLLDPRPPTGGPAVELSGRLLARPWEIMALNGEQLREDIPAFFPGYAVEELPGCHILGDGLLTLGSDVRVEPGSVFDLTDGPIRLADGVRVRSHTRLAGPAFVGPGSALLGGVLGEVSMGPVCKIRGEVECSVIQGFTNKAHDGFLGHACLGRWVNLGAMTTNSDLKNNYGPVRVGSPDGPVETGLLKVGCLLGDHVKTGIGTLLNTGTVVGAGSNLFGTAMPPLYVPPFSWGSGGELVPYELERFLDVARKAMGRREVALEEEMQGMLRQAWEGTRSLRSGAG